VISIHFNLQPINTATFTKLLVSGRLLGDVFNGWLKRWLIDTNPTLFAALRPPHSERALYVSHIHQIALEPGVDGLAVQITLLGDAASQTNELLGSLLNLEVIELGPPQCLLTPFQFTVAEPGRTPISLFDIDTGFYEELPQTWLAIANQTQLPKLANTNQIKLTVLTPPRLGQLDSDELPSLSQLVKNLAKKLSLAEPTTAHLLGLETKDWYDQERELKLCSLIKQTVQPVHWAYQSENQRMHTRHSWTGTLQYHGTIGAKVVQLLWLGQWLGLGQNASGGQGLYTLQLETN
jgi:hypothetical protein